MVGPDLDQTRIIVVIQIDGVLQGLLFLVFLHHIVGRWPKNWL